MWYLTLLKSKYTYIVIAIVGIVAYYNVKILGMNITYNLKESEFNKLFKDFISLEGDIDEVKLDLEICLEVNSDNTDVLNTHNNDIKQLKQAHKIIIDGKNSQIIVLQKTIHRLRNLPKPVFDDAIVVEDCVIKVHKGEQNDKIINDFIGFGI